MITAFPKKYSLGNRAFKDLSIVLYELYLKFRQNFFYDSFFTLLDSLLSQLLRNFLIFASRTFCTPFEDHLCHCLYLRRRTLQFIGIHSHKNFGVLGNVPLINVTHRLGKFNTVHVTLCSFTKGTQLFEL